MARPISSNDVDEVTRAAVFPYDAYRAWDLGEPVEQPLFMLSTRLVRVRAREDWNRLGRETYDRAVMLRHADAVLSSLAESSGSRWLVRRAGRPRPWLPADASSDAQVLRLRSFLERHAPAGLDRWDGGFVLDDELAPWLRQLVDYPFVTKGREVELVGFDLGLLILLTHHLDIQVFARDEAVLDRMEGTLAQAGVHVHRVASPA